MRDGGPNAPIFPEPPALRVSMTRQGTIAMNTRPVELSPAMAFSAGLLKECIAQFLTGIVSRCAGCAKLAGIQSVAAINATPYNRIELLLTGGLLLPVLIGRDCNVQSFS
jgi:hypothetical protein